MELVKLGSCLTLAYFTSAIHSYRRDKQETKLDNQIPVRLSVMKLVKTSLLSNPIK